MRVLARCVRSIGGSCERGALEGDTRGLDGERDGRDGAPGLFKKLASRSSVSRLLKLLDGWMGVLDRAAEVARLGREGEATSCVLLFQLAREGGIRLLLLVGMSVDASGRRLGCEAGL